MSVYDIIFVQYFGIKTKQYIALQGPPGKQGPMGEKGDRGEILIERFPVEKGEKGKVLTQYYFRITIHIML